MKQIIVTISADISDDLDVEHEALVAAKAPAEEMVRVLAAHGLTATVVRKISHPKGRRGPRNSFGMQSPTEDNGPSAATPPEVAQAAE